MNYEPTDTAVRELLAILCDEHGFRWTPENMEACQTILERFVRREEHGLALKANDALRAELRGQRCDGSGRLRGSGDGSMVNPYKSLACPVCPACKPKATPKCGETRDAVGALCGSLAAGRKHFLECPLYDVGSGSTVSCKDDSGSTAEKRDGTSEGVTDARLPLAAPVPQVLTIELGPTTLRALYECLYEVGLISDIVRINLLAALKETKG